MLGLTRDTSPDAFIPQDHEALALKKQVEESSGLTEPIAVGVIRDRSGGIFDPASLRLIASLTSAIQRLPEIAPDEVISLATESGVYFDEEGEPGFDRLLKEIPDTAAGLEALKNDILGYELYRGTLVAADGSAACVLIRPSDERQADAIYRGLAELVRDFPVNDERLVVAGEAAVRSHMGQAVSDDALRMNFICPLVMVGLIVLAYRTVRGTVLPLCVIGGASALALGLMAAADVPIYIVTNGIFVIIMALGVADSLHLVGQYYEEQLHPAGRAKQQLIVDACMALWYPVLITSLTDVAGFFALYLAGKMPPIRYFGLFTCLGVLGALIYSYTVVPAGLMVRPLKTSRAFLRRNTASWRAGDMDIIGRSMHRLGSVVFRRRYIVLGAGAAAIVLAGWGASRLIINDARILAFKDHHPIVQATNALNERFDGTSQLNVIVTASETGALLQADLLHRIEELEAFTETLPYVGGTHSPAGWVKRAHQKMHDEDPAYYAIPQDPFDTRFYLDVLGIDTSPMAGLLHEVIDPTYSRANLIVRMTSSEFIHQRAVIKALQEHLDEHFSQGPLRAKLAGRVNLDYHWLRMIRTSHINSVALSFTCVLLLTGLMFRSLTAGLLCMFTVGVAVLVNYAVMGFADIPLGVGTAMFASIAIGAGVNFPIHMLDRLRLSLGSPRADGTEPGPAEVFPDAFAFTGRVLFFTAFVVAVGFLLLCVSEFRTLVRFGLLIGISMLVSFLTSVTLLPALVASLRPRFVWTPAKAEPHQLDVDSSGPPA
ncbi:MAG: efflux RND transporter permease subunit, partial [Planctomycetota bacterium]|jgi:predicted RND superfamily exporter protein